MRKMNIEIKAKIENLKRTKKIIENLPSKRIACYIQKDTYFNVKEGRLKLREIEDRDPAQLIYYNRENIPCPKRSNLLIFEAKNSGMLKEILGKALGIKIVVEKRRELYDYKGTRIHLDLVKNLGSFIEFEKPTENREEDIRESRKFLNTLLKKLKINKRNLMKGSYSDMLLKKC